jgi:hypothetical protein
MELSMDKKTTAIIITVAACLLCACPGIFGIFMGLIFAIASVFPGADIDILGSPDPKGAMNFGIISGIIGLVLIIIAGVVIFFAWKKKKNAM